jgi:hypothetical protein
MKVLPEMPLALVEVVKNTRDVMEDNYFIRKPKKLK